VIFIQTLKISQIITPTEISVSTPSTLINYKNNQVMNEIKKDLKTLGAPEKELESLSRSIKMASETTNINSKIITSLMYTESTFKKDVISSKGYKGLMQTPEATFKFSEVDTLLGAKVLQEKLNISNGNLLEALTLYKGGNNNASRQYAKEVLQICELL